MKTPITVLRLCLGAGAVCLAVWDCDRAQAAAAPAPIEQSAATNHPPVRLTPSTGLKKLESRANRGDAASQYELGVRYAKADSPPMAKQEAVVWYRKAAEQGFAKAQAALGHCYAHGEGVVQDYGEAVKWYRKAAEQGEAGAQNNVGVRYESGTGVAQNCVEAVKWYRKAADQGDASAQYNLGECYWVGHGVQQDYAEAVKWFRKAAKEGDADAQCFLGECYWRGRGVQQDYAEAVKWFRKALEQGSELARTDLARAEAQHYPRRNDQTQREAAEAAAAQRRAVDANWYKDVSQRADELASVPGAQSMEDVESWRRLQAATRPGDYLLRGVSRPPMPTPRPPRAPTYTPEFTEGQSPSEEAGKIKILSDIVSDYHRNHTYVGDGVFVCGDMACDVWNMVVTKGIAAKIQVGNVERQITSLHEANHAWVLAETSPGSWLALETTAGRVVGPDENDKYYSGWSFANPKEFKDYLYYGHR